MPYTKQELEKLRSELPRGSAEVIAKKTGLKTGTVRNILSGLSKNDAVVIAALEVVETHKTVEVKTKETIAAL